VEPVHTLYSCTCPVTTYISLDANGETLVVKSVQSERPIYDVSNRLFLDEKRRGLDSTLLLNSTYWQIAVFVRRIVAEKIAKLLIAIFRRPNLRAECQRPELPARFVLGLRGGGGWQSAVHLRADCQLVILIVANHGIGARKLATQLNAAPAIFHRETAYLTHHRFLTHDFSSVKLICAAMFGLKLYTHGLS
jgi:hypothetical protein